MNQKSKTKGVRMMRNKITAVTLLLLLALFTGIPAEAAFKTKLTLTIAPHSDIPSHEVSPDLLDEHGIFTGSKTETRTFTDTQGRSVTETETEFRNVDGVLLMSADIEITARSEDFTVKSGEIFAENFSVDVTLSLNDRSYNEYQYTLGIEGLPEWLEVSGELLSADVLNRGITEHHHEFSVSGTPGGSFDTATLRFTAVVYVSGDVPVMRVMTSKDVTISAEIVPKPPEPPEPEPPAPVPKSDDISPDVVPKDSIETIEEDPRACSH